MHNTGSMFSKVQGARVRHDPPTSRPLTKHEILESPLTLSR